MKKLVKRGRPRGKGKRLVRQPKGASSIEVHRVSSGVHVDCRVFPPGRREQTVLVVCYGGSMLDTLRWVEKNGEALERAERRAR